MHKITFLDASTVGDVDLSGLEQFGDLERYASTSANETAARLADTTIAITNKAIIGADVISNSKKLELICVAATGTNCVDLEAAKIAGIPVRNVAGYSTASVTQHAVGMMINLAASLHRYAAEAKMWAHSPIFTRLDYPVTDLAGKTLGVVGLGSIGRSVARVAMALGMDVIALARDGSTDDGDIARMGRDTFFATADVVSLHCPLTPETREMINSETLGMMKPSAFLINTGRGDLINEPDLAKALKNGTIAGAGLDVLSQEPPGKDHILLDQSIPNLIITPHTAWASKESRQRLIEGVLKNISAHIHG